MIRTGSERGKGRRRKREENLDSINGECLDVYTANSK